MGKMRFQIKILGPPTMVWRDQSFKLSRRQARGLLYYLASSLQPVARDRLCFLLWPDIPDLDARRRLTRLLSYLRVQLPDPNLLLVDNETISLEPDKVWSDASEFARLSAKQLPEAKQMAIELYRGTFLKGFSLPKCPEYERWISDEGSRCERVYRSTLLELIKAKHASHDLASAIQYAQAYLEVDELAEEIHRQLISLYAQNGDQTAAMRQFETCTLILEQELGVAPIPQTRAAFDAAQSGAAHLKAAPQTKPVWTVLPSLDLPLIGREEAWESLQDAYRKLHRGGVIFIRGEPGVGKSRLLQEFATSQQQIVLSGNCHTSTQALPYHPLTQALRQALSQAQLWQGIRPIWLSEASRLLPELIDLFPNLPQPIEVEPVQAQARLYEALAQCILGLAANAPTLLCLDDLQWADEATHGWLSFIARRLANSSLSILAAYRTAAESELADLRESFRRMELLAEISLSGLSTEAILAILKQLPNPAPTPSLLAERIKDATDGNPFFVLETLRAMLESDQLASPTVILPLADTVQEAILMRLEKLSPVARQVLEAAAVLETDLDLNLLQETAGRAEFEIADALDELVRRQMLFGGDPPRLRHDLLTQVVYQSLNPWRRRLLHRRAGRALEGLDLEKEAGTIAQIAGHYDAAGEYEQAVDAYRQSAMAASQRYAQDEAIGYLERALELANEQALDPQRYADLFDVLGDSLYARGEFEAARQAYENWLAYLPAEEFVQRAEVQRKLAKTFIAQRRRDEAQEALETALELLGPGPEDRSLAWQSAWLDIQLARLDVLYFQFKLEQLDLLLEQVRPVLDEIGKPNQHIGYYTGQLYLLAHKERFALTDESIRIAENVLRVIQDSGDAAAIAHAKFGLGFHSLWAGRLQTALDALIEGLKMAEEIGLTMTQCLCLTYLAYGYRLHGDLESVHASARRGLEVAQWLGIRQYIGSAQAHLAWLEWREGKLVAAQNNARQALSMWTEDSHPFQWSAHWVLNAIFLAHGQLTGAVESARAMLHPAQQRLPDEITVALEQGVQFWDGGDLNSAQNSLQHAVELAKELGYL